ncbi:MAG: carboxymuconolactone decarboxylase family protein [Chloroflexi bacterium]|nr:carboxymuconolactone decarboxylase family protein [Chloroflexota bacterium]
MTAKKKIAWIETVEEADAVGDVEAAYREAGDKKTGRVDHVMKIHSLHPRSMLDHEYLYRTLMYGEGPLKRAQREMIATVVSAINHCKY